MHSHRETHLIPRPARAGAMAAHRRALALAALCCLALMPASAAASGHDRASSQTHEPQEQEGPELALSHELVDYGLVDVQGPLPAHRTVIATNTGDQLLTITGVELIGDEDSYALPGEQPTSASVAPGDTFAITVAYQPAAAAMHTATLAITSDALSGPTTHLPITGRGMDRHIAVSTLDLRFPDTRRNPARPSRQAVTIGNTGEAALRISEIVVDGADAAAFSLVGPAINGVAPLGSHELIIEFAPDAARSYQAALIIASDDSDRPTAMVQLAGAGVLPGVEILPAAGLELVAGLGCPARVADTGAGPALINLDDEAFTVRELRLVDHDGDAIERGVFRVVHPAPGHELAPLGGVDIDIELTARAPGVYEATLEIYLDADALPAITAPLRGRVEEIHDGNASQFVLDDCPRTSYYACASHPGDGAPWSTLVLAAAALAALRRRRAA